MPCDYKKYHPEWKSRIRPDILKRANDCCEVCKVKNGMAIFRGTWEGEKVFQTIDGLMYKESGELIMENSEYEPIIGKSENSQAIRVVLTIAHLDHDTANNDYSNLKALCQLHHLRHDIAHHKQTRRKNKGLQELFK